MARAFRFILALALIATLVVGASLSHAKPASQVRATSFIPVQTPIGELSDSQLERALVSEIHRVANQAFAEIKAKDPTVRVTQLKKVERAVIHKLKETGKLVQLARSLDPKIGISVVATEVVATAMGFGLIAAGQVAAGGAILGFPSAPLLLSVLLTYEVFKIRWKVARELNSSARELEKIRKQVIGYNAKNKITSMLLQDAEVQRELELVNKFVEVSKDKPQIITLKEIESIILKMQGGESFLAHAYHERGNKEVYATLLLEFLNQSPEGLAKITEQIVRPSSERQTVVKSLKAKLLPVKSNGDVTEFPELRKHLLEVSDIQKHVDRELQSARREISTAKKKVKKGELTKEEALQAKQHFKSEIARLREVQIQSFRHQYALILAAKGFIEVGDNNEVAKLVKSREADLAELRVLSSFARIQAHAKSVSLPAEFRGETPSSKVIRSCEQIFARAN